MNLGSSHTWGYDKNHTCVVNWSFCHSFDFFYPFYSFYSFAYNQLFACKQFIMFRDIAVSFYPFLFKARSLHVLALPCLEFIEYAYCDILKFHILWVRRNKILRVKYAPFCVHFPPLFTCVAKATWMTWQSKNCLLCLSTSF